MQYFGFVGTPDMGDLNVDNMQDMAKLGMAMGIANNVINANNDVFAPVMQNAQTGAVPPTGWVCSCGNSCTSGSFCPECGTKRPDAAWNCSCGMSGLTSKFCTNCGKKRP